MVKIEDVKTISHEVVASHNARGFAIVSLTPTDQIPVGVLLNVTKDPWVKEGPELRAKADVRTFLWAQSQGAGLRRQERSCVWSRYVKEENRSVMGIATVVSRGVAERMTKLNDGYQWIEVGT